MMLGCVIKFVEMKQQIYNAILDIIAEKRANGDVLPYAMSIEVAHRLHMNALEVEKIAATIDGIEKSRTLNHDCYYYGNKR